MAGPNVRKIRRDAVANANSSDLNPIQNSNDWAHIVIAGQVSPGVIAINGISGFVRETGWDKKKGKGAKGVTLTLVQFPPAEGSIRFQLWNPAQFVEWDNFRFLFRYNTAKTGLAPAYDVYHPALADLGINSVVTSKISPIVHVGRGMYEVTVDMIEWFPPPAVSVVQTPTMSTPETKETIPGAPPDPVGDAIDKQIASELAIAQKPL